MLELGGPSSAAGADPAWRQEEPARRPERIVSDVQPSSRRVGEALESLEQVIASRKGSDPDRSYTARLLAGGVAAAGAKVTEEAGELVQAAAAESDDRVVSEAADVLYHTLVLLACRELPLARVEDELARRFGVSGLAEKAARTAGGGAG
jgi:phosphoribosyl-AMP cyclohydrolase / phosphoribosyl-ATP pyrophosphohydrolase